MRGAYWQDLPLDGAETTDWRALVPRFVDVTGRPGPSNWQAAAIRTARKSCSHGISWFEAAAYCRFRGKELPTAYHWYAPRIPCRKPGFTVIVHRPAEQFLRSGVAVDGQDGGAGPYGTYDMAAMRASGCGPRARRAGGTSAGRTWIHLHVCPAEVTPPMDGQT